LFEKLSDYQLFKEYYALWSERASSLGNASLCHNLTTCTSVPIRCALM